LAPTQLRRRRPRPRPKRKGKKKSGWQSRPATLTRELYGKTKAQLAQELATETAARAEAETRAAAAAAAQEAREAATTPENAAKMARGLEGLARMAADYMARRRGAHWKLSETESKGWGESAAEALGPWLAPFAEHLPMAVFIGVTYTLIDDRAALDERLRRRGESPVFDGDPAPTVDRYASSNPEPAPPAAPTPPNASVNGNRIIGPIVGP
jgi:hypothetical protein